MPHFNCASCGARLYSAASPLDLLDPACPACLFTDPSLALGLIPEASPASLITTATALDLHA